MHAIRGPNAGTGTSSGHSAAIMIASWWHCQQEAELFTHMLPDVMSRIGSLERLDS